jgi:hypothetical protein
VPEFMQRAASLGMQRNICDGGDTGSGGATAQAKTRARCVFVVVEGVLRSAFHGLYLRRRTPSPRFRIFLGITVLRSVPAECSAGGGGVTQGMSGYVRVAQMEVVEHSRVNPASVGLYPSDG